MTAVRNRPATRTEPGSRFPGEPGLWVAILGDLVLFSMLFVAALWERRDEPAAYAAGAKLLHVNVGLVNTLILVSSSLCVALAASAYRDGQRPRAAAMVTAGLGLGIAFVVVKSGEWAFLIADGITPRTDTFFTYYFVITYMHMIHVLIGLAILANLRRRLAAPLSAETAEPRLVGVACTFWHFVDLVWLIIFPLIYLVPR